MILRLGRIPVIDSTGLVALENAIATLMRHEQQVVLAGPLPEPRKVFEKARLGEKYPRLRVAHDLSAAIPDRRRAQRRLRRGEDPPELAGADVQPQRR